MDEILNTTPTTETPRIFRLQVTLPDGKRRWRLVKCPYYAKDPAASLFGLTAKMAELELQGEILGHSVLVPATISPAQRQKLVRWNDAVLAMLA